MKIGIYGGSFNPIHFGHIGLAKWVIGHTDLDEVWLMVSPNNPLKDKSILADEQERLQKAREAIGDGILAIGDEAKGKRIWVSDFEFHLPRPTYTANTLRALAKEYPNHEFTLIIGEDNLQIFDQWREYQYILDNYRVFVYPRRDKASTKGATQPAAGTQPREATLPAKGTIFLTGAPYFDISSTELRKNLHI
jgi:nicotinate-nucleotide adenylyltransferase